MADTVQDNTLTNEAQTIGVWLVIEITTSTIELGRNNAIKTDKNGLPVRVPDEKHWRPLLPDEVPEFLKSPDAISDMVNGQRICLDPAGGGHWYRAITCYPDATDTVN